MYVHQNTHPRLFQAATSPLGASELDARPARREYLGRTAAGRLPRAKKAPTRTIQMLGQEDVPSKGGWPQPCDVCDAPVDSVIDDAGIDDESASIVIVGGGPHALAALAALHEGSLSFGQYASDSTFERKVGFGSLKKVGTGSCRLPTPSHAQQPPTSRLAAMLTGACVRASQCA